MSMTDEKLLEMKNLLEMSSAPQVIEEATPMTTFVGAKGFERVFKMKFIQFMENVGVDLVEEMTAADGTMHPGDASWQDAMDIIQDFSAEVEKGTWQGVKKGMKKIGKSII